MWPYATILIAARTLVLALDLAAHSVLLIQMLFPHFTIRTLLILITVCAFAFVIAGFAVRGEHWALAVTVGLVSVLFTLLIHAAWFAAVWLLSQLQSKPPTTSDEPVIKLRDEKL